MKKMLRRKRKGIASLAEVLAALVIASLVAVAVIQIYNRANSTAESVNRFIERDDAAQSVLQRIAEDIDKLANSGSDAVLRLENKFDSGFNITRLTIENRIYDNNEPMIFEKITWQSRYDEGTGGLVLYRAHSGQAVEDKVLVDYGTEGIGASKDRELFVPVCSGISFFKIDVPKSNPQTNNMSDSNMPANPSLGQDSNIPVNPVLGQDSNMPESLTLEQDMIPSDDKWDQNSLPKSLRLMISFGPTIKLATGGFDVEEWDRIYRTVAIDRIRKIKYQFVRKDFNLSDSNGIDDSVDANDSNNVNDVNVPVDTAVYGR